MKRLYECLAVLIKNNDVQTMTSRGVGTKEEITGLFLDNVQATFPTHVINKIFVNKVSMNDLLEILEQVDISEPQANFIKKTLEQKGY